MVKGTSVTENNLRSSPPALQLTSRTIQLGRVETCYRGQHTTRSTRNFLLFKSSRPKKTSGIKVEIKGVIMAEENGQNKQEYGVPLYTGSWVPTSIPLNKKPNKNEDQEEEEEEESESKQKQWLILSGGGGQGKSGIPNSILLVQHDGATNSLSQNPVANHGTGTEIPYRMAVHPRGEGLLCSFPESCRWFEWETENNELGIRSSERVLAQLENVGQQLALTFNKEGSVLAVGGEDGHLRVFKWPSMEVILDEAEAHATVKDLDFSSDGKFLASLGGGGPCRIWDITSSTVVASLPKEKDEQFRYLRFSPTSDNKEILCIAALQGQKVSIVLWDTTSWSRIRSKKISIDSMTAFNVSADGKLFAIATLDAHIHIMNSSSMMQVLRLEKAHRGITTALQFSEDSRFLLSTSFDSSVRVTRIEYKKKQNRLSILMVIALILVIVAFLLREKIQTQFIL